MEKEKLYRSASGDKSAVTQAFSKKGEMPFGPVEAPYLSLDMAATTSSVLTGEGTNTGTDCTDFAGQQWSLQCGEGGWRC